MSLRERLRRDTRAAHDIVDASFERFDLSTVHGYREFLACHGDALRQIRPSHGSHEQLTCDVRAMLGRLDKDLAILGGQHRQSPLPSTRRLHPVSVEYVLLGSHMGMQILHKRWLKARHPATSAASRFLSTPLEPLRWKTFCSLLSTLPDNGSIADTIVADALSVFSIYTQAADGLSLSHAGG